MDVFATMQSPIALGNIGCNRDRAPAHLPAQSVGFVRGKRADHNVRTLGKRHRPLPGDQISKRASHVDDSRRYPVVARTMRAPTGTVFALIPDP